MNYWSIFIASVAAIGLGSLWYGVFFKKQWMEIIGAAKLTSEQQQEMQSQMNTVYALQFGVTILQVTVLSLLLKDTFSISGITYAFLVWLGFVVPTLVGSVLWTNESVRHKRMRFFIQAGYQLCIFILFAIILTW